MWDYLDSQEVGLEAATLERVRNSSLVEWFCADNPTGLKPVTEAVGVGDAYSVGERSGQRRRGIERRPGAARRENVGMSSV